MEIKSFAFIIFSFLAPSTYLNYISSINLSVLSDQQSKHALNDSFLTYQFTLISNFITLVSKPAFEAKFT